jgi:hypothetical protein
VTLSNTNTEQPVCSHRAAHFLPTIILLPTNPVPSIGKRVLGVQVMVIRMEVELMIGEVRGQSFQ